MLVVVVVVVVVVAVVVAARLECCRRKITHNITLAVLGGLALGCMLSRCPLFGI